MIRRPPRSTLTDTLFPYTPLFRSFVVPQRDSAADDLVSGGLAEVATVETVADLPVHEQDFAGVDAAAALPARQIASDAILLQPRADLDAIDGAGEVRPADRNSGGYGKRVSIREELGGCRHIK